MANQFLLNFLFGETNQLTSPVTEIARASAVVKVQPKKRAAVQPCNPVVEVAGSKPHE